MSLFTRQYTVTGYAIKETQTGMFFLVKEITVTGWFMFKHVYWTEYDESLHALYETKKDAVADMRQDINARQPNRVERAWYYTADGSTESAW